MTVTLDQLLQSPVFDGLQTALQGEAANDGSRLRAVHGPTQLDRAGQDDLVVVDVGDPDDAAQEDRLMRAMSGGIAAALVVLHGSRPSVPLRLKRAATRWGVTLVAVHGDGSAADLTPRLELVLAQAEAQRLGELERFTHGLLEELRSGHGLSGLVEAAAAVLDAPVVLASGTRRIVAMAGIPEGSDVDAVLAEAVASVPVTLGGAAWGGLSTTAGSASRHSSVGEILSRLAAVTELELLRSSETLRPTDRARRELLTDLLSGRASSASHVLQRAEVLGLRLSPDEPLIALAVSASAFGRAELERALQRHGVAALWAAFDDDILVIATARSGEPAAEAGIRLADTLAGMAHAGSDETVVALGPVAWGVAEAGRAVREARSTLAIARSTGVHHRVVTASMLIVDRLLSRVAEDAEVVRTIDEALGPLRELRAGRAGTLEATLSAYLDCGGAKTETAHRLGIRRQSLYSRLEQLDRLVGPLDDPERRLALHIVVRADRLLRGWPVQPTAVAVRSA
jgi:PucR family transcriptional regulator, purine catabolism regulatory protein